MSTEAIIAWALIAGTILVIPVLLHPIGPSLLGFAMSPIDPVLSNLLGMWGNYLTGLPLALLLLKTNPARWVQTFFGSRVQIAFFLFVLATALAHGIGYMTFGAEIFLVYLQKVTGFFLIGLFAVGLRNERFMSLCAKTVVVGMTAYAMISMLEFYFGIHLLPTQSEWGEAGLIGSERSINVNLSRLRGAGDSLPINRFAFQLLVPTILAMGWLAPRARRGFGLLPFFCLIVLLTALIGTMSRGGLLSIMVGGAIVMIVSYRLKPAAILATLALTIVLAVSATQALRYLDVGEELQSRVTGSELGAGTQTRQQAWVHGLQLFADSPIWGVGYGIWSTDRVPLGNAPPDPHNAYIRILAFYGILGGAAFIYLVYTLYSVLLRSARDVGDAFEHWRGYFLAGLTALMLMNMFNSYLFDRYIFLISGFAAALEHARREAALRNRAEARENHSPLSTQPAVESPA